MGDRYSLVTSSHVGNTVLITLYPGRMSSVLNNAEESFQDASHLFSTQHPWAQTIRTVVNLEAAGSKGPELLFQATSEEMVRVYQGVPYPHGTVLANDIFASGIMMSEYVVSHSARSYCPPCKISDILCYSQQHGF